MWGGRQVQESAPKPQNFSVPRKEIALLNEKLFCFWSAKQKNQSLKDKNLEYYT